MIKLFTMLAICVATVSAQASTCRVFSNMDTINMDQEALEIFQSDLENKGYKFVEFQGDANMILKNASAYCYYGNNDGCVEARSHINLISLDDNNKNLDVLQGDTGIFFGGSRKVALRKALNEVPYCK